MTNKHGDNWRGGGELDIPPGAGRLELGIHAVFHLPIVPLIEDHPMAAHAELEHPQAENLAVQIPHLVRQEIERHARFQEEINRRESERFAREISERPTSAEVKNMISDATQPMHDMRACLVGIEKSIAHLGGLYASIETLRADMHEVDNKIVSEDRVKILLRDEIKESKKGLIAWAGVLLAVSTLIVSIVSVMLG